MAEELERTYVIPLRKVKNVKRTIRAPRAIREVQNFLMKHMKAEEVKLDASINEFIPLYLYCSSYTTMYCPSKTLQMQSKTKKFHLK